MSAIAAGSLDGMGVNDILMVGTQTNILAYDVQNNTDIFYNDVSMMKVLYLILLSAMKDAMKVLNE